MTTNKAAQKNTEETAQKPVGLYIHIPFCVQKCRYCDFLSFPVGDTAPEHRQETRQATEVMQPYVDGLCQELSCYDRRQSGTEKIPVDTVFIGGGTPSLLSVKQMEQVMEAVGRYFSLLPDAEISIESNPGTLTPDKLSAYRRMGIRRLSMGVQSTDDRLLSLLGRIHTGAGFREQYRLARQAGFDNINLDLMFGLPEQTMTDWQETLREILKLRPEHLSFYSLQLEEGTPFFRDYRDGKMDLPQEETDREMYHWAIAALRDAGYEPYEISNGSLPGYRCRHNLKYWSYEPYIGAGLGAHSFSREKGRSCNVREPDRYLQQVQRGMLPRDPNGYEALTEREAMGEYVFTGLRKTEGISLAAFAHTFHRSFWDVYEQQSAHILLWQQEGWIEIKDGRFRLTEQGIDVSNRIMAEFV